MRYLDSGADDRSKKDYAVCRTMAEYGVSETEARALLNEGSKTKVNARRDGYWRRTWTRAVRDAETNSKTLNGGETGSEADLENAIPPTTDEDDVALVETAIREFRDDGRTTPRAFEYLMDLVQGRYAKRGFDDDRRSAEVSLASKLYGALRWAGVDRDRRERCVLAYISESCEGHGETDDGQVRPWTERDNQYRRETVRTALSTFNLEAWERWRRKRETPYQHTDDYSPTTYDYVLKALRATYDEGPGYPSKSKVVNVAQALDPSRKRRTHENALRKLRRELGQAKLARIGSTEWVYYPASAPDPENAIVVRHSGEKYTIER